MGFPNKKYPDIEQFSKDYFLGIAAASAAISPEALDLAASILGDLYTRGSTLYVCGNGGSATISDSFVCDHTKLIATGTRIVPRVVSLSSNVAMLSAIANDISYDDVFSYQLGALARPRDALLVVSASGNSENVVRAAKLARERAMDVIAITGFSGGRVAEFATCHIHVPADNYGVVEDICQSLMHILAQFIRQSLMEPEAIRAVKF